MRSPRLFIAGLYGLVLAPLLMAAGEAPRGAPLTIAEIRSLTPEQFADRALAVVAASAVDLDAPWLVHEDGTREPLAALRLALRPKSSFNGVCEASILRLTLTSGEETYPSRPLAEQRLEGVDTELVYKVRGDLDQNHDHDDALAALCAKDKPFQDEYFFAPDARTAQEAGQIIEALQREASSKVRTFRVTCDPGVTCASASARLGALQPDQIRIVREKTPCAEGKSCSEILYAPSPDCLSEVTVQAYYRGSGAKGWGQVRVERVILKPESCSHPGAGSKL